jgi:hypothetical protein
VATDHHGKRAKRVLSHTFVQGLKYSPDGRNEYWDAEEYRFGVQVSRTGYKAFILYVRVPGSKSPTRLPIGNADAMGLAAARDKARAWKALLAEGKDPREVARQEALEAQRAKRITFSKVAEDWLADVVRGKQRKGHEVEGDINREFVPRWGNRPIADITPLDVRDVIKEIAKRTPAQARNLLGHLKRLFSWAVGQGVYGIEASPAERWKAKGLIGKKKRRDRTLTDDEVFALWRIAKRMPAPRGPVYQMLMLTALRLNEAARAELSEFDPAFARLFKTVDADALKALPDDKKVWIIPAERMKGRNEEARPHAVPLTDEMIDILAALPRYKGSKFLFTTTFGNRPVSIGSKVKNEIDARMLRTLRALARQRGDDPGVVELPPWVNHDIRRTIRSALSALKVAEEVREAVIAHARPGIKGTYDLYGYLDEKREALNLWAARLRSIVNPPADNVVPLRAERQ